MYDTKSKLPSCTWSIVKKSREIINTQFSLFFTCAPALVAGYKRRHMCKSLRKISFCLIVYKLLELHYSTKILISSDHSWLLHIHRTPLCHHTPVHHVRGCRHVHLPNGFTAHVHIHPQRITGVHHWLHATVSIVSGVRWRHLRRILHVQLVHTWLCWFFFMRHWC